MKPGDFKGHEIDWRHYVAERRLPTYTRVPDRRPSKDTSLFVMALVVAGLLLMVLT